MLMRRYNFSVHNIHSWDNFLSPDGKIVSFQDVVKVLDPRKYTPLERRSPTGRYTKDIIKVAQSLNLTPNKKTFTGKSKAQKHQDFLISIGVLQKGRPTQPKSFTEFSLKMGDDCKLPEPEPEALPKVSHQQKISLGLLQWATKNHRIGIIRNYVLLRQLYTVRKTACLSFAIVEKIFSKNQLKSILDLKLISYANGKYWLTGTDKVKEILGIKDNRYIFIKYEDVKNNFVRTIIEAAAYAYSRRCIKKPGICVDYLNEGAQQTSFNLHKSGISVRLLASILGLSPKTVQQNKGTNFIRQSAYMVTDFDDYHFIMNGRKFFRPASIFTGKIDMIYA